MTTALTGLDLRVPAALGVALTAQTSLATYTTIKVGGPAEYFAVVNHVDQLIKLVRWARVIALPYFILGGGSNILISDAGIRGLVIYNRCRRLRIDAPPCCDHPSDDRPYLFAESGAAFAGAARTSVNAGLTGLEWAVSVPGTVGGAVLGNAGAHGGEVKDSLAYAWVLDADGDVVEMPVEGFAYAYRDSSLKRRKLLAAGFHPVILSANFRLAEGDPAAIGARAAAYLRHRRATQPVEPSLGSTFVNPPGDFAGRLIEAAGLKGASRGGVAVSHQHANFFVNPGGIGAATATDVLQLMEHVQATVRRTFGVELIPEVQLVGQW
jgi:UDP-N-acetylmuramate dehydrogenase